MAADQWAAFDERHELIDGDVLEDVDAAADPADLDAIDALAACPGRSGAAMPKWLW